jgi:mRNA interferase MazF
LSKSIRQGDVVWADPDPTRGREQAKPRPFVIASVDQLNRSGLGLSVAVPLTRTDFENPLHLRIEAPEGGLRETSFAMPEQLRALAHERVSRRLGTLRPATLSELLRRCRLLLSETVSKP